MTAPAGKRHALRVNAPTERRLREGYPWVWHDGILQGGQDARSGELGVVFDRRDRFLAIGLLDPDSPIRLRVLHAGNPRPIDAAWFRLRMEEAAEIRASLRDPRLATDGFRLINGESDGFPGLVADRYADTVVVKLYTGAWIPHLGSVLAALGAVHPHARTVLRLSRAVQELPGLPASIADGRVLRGPALDGPVLFSENGLRFEAEPVVGQKTGFFLDQRDNRAAVGDLAAGRDVLNVFSYTGGFSLYAARGHARSVASVDISRPATDACVRNFAHNRHLKAVAQCRHEPVCGDAFQVLERYRLDGRTFGMVILDPPMFAQAASQVDGALQAYGRLTLQGLSVLQPGGILVQASCSNRVTEEQFFGRVRDAARSAGRTLELLARTGHAVDHPATFSDGSYLKCLFARA